MLHPFIRSKALMTGILVAAGTYGTALPVPALAQGSQFSNAIPESAAITLQAKIRSIDPANRHVTLVGGSGQVVVLTAGPSVRLEMLKSGDTVNVKYYRSVVFLLVPPGAPVQENQISDLVVQNAQAPGGYGIQRIRVSGLVVGMDMAAHSIDVVNPAGGGVYTIDVTDPARQMAMSALKVGDTITAVVSQALAVSIEPAPKSWL
jgi:hypothetical protein